MNTRDTDLMDGTACRTFGHGTGYVRTLPITDPTSTETVTVAMDRDTGLASIPATDGERHVRALAVLATDITTYTVLTRSTDREKFVSRPNIGGNNTYCTADETIVHSGETLCVEWPQDQVPVYAVVTAVLERVTR